MSSLGKCHILQLTPHLEFFGEKKIMQCPCFLCDGQCRAGERRPICHNWSDVRQTQLEIQNMLFSLCNCLLMIELYLLNDISQIQPRLGVVTNKGGIAISSKLKPRKDTATVASRDPEQPFDIKDSWQHIFLRMPSPFYL